MTQGLINKLVSVLEATLGKLGRYDEGSLIGSLLSFTVNIYFPSTSNILTTTPFPTFQNVSGSGKELGQGYVNFARNNIDLIRSKINDDLWILNFFEQWYTKQITILCTWLSERLDHSLHVFQCTCLAHIVKVCQTSFETMRIPSMRFLLENLFGLRVARRDGRQIELQGISDCQHANAGGRGDVSTDDDIRRRRR